MQAKWLLGALKGGVGEGSSMLAVGCARYVSNTTHHPPINWVAAAAAIAAAAFAAADVQRRGRRRLPRLLCCARPCVSVSAAHIVGRR